MVEAIVLMKILGGTGESLEWARSIKKKISETAGVIEVFGVFGGYDMVARIRAKDLEDLTAIVTDKLRSIPGVEDTETLIVIF
jgi:DNA-binding Lrp family transcriptional regulator